MASEMDGHTSKNAKKESHEEEKQSLEDTEALRVMAGKTNEENGEEESHLQASKKESIEEGNGDNHENKDVVKETETQTEKKERDENEKKMNTNETGIEEDVKENIENVVEQEQRDGSSEAKMKSDEMCVKEEIEDEKNEISDSVNPAPTATETEIKVKDEAQAEVKKANTRDKKEKTKGKSGLAPSSSVPRPSMQASSRQRSARPSARRDAMAKFQQDTTPVVRNFKVQKTSGGISVGASIKQKILHWCNNKTRSYEGVSIENFSSSWSDGLAFCALIHRFFPSAFDFSSLKANEREKNFTLAFSMAESLAGCCPLLDVSDMVLMRNKPDPFSVFTYVQSLCQHLSKIEQERREQKKAEESKKQGEAEGKIEQGEEAGGTEEQRSGEEQENAVEEEEHEGEGSADEEKGSTEEKHSSTQVETGQTIDESTTAPAVETLE